MLDEEARPAAGRYQAVIGSGPDAAAVAVSISRPDTVGEVLRQDMLAPSLALAEAGAPIAPPPPPMAPAPPAVVPPAAPAALSFSALSAYAACGYRHYLERVLGLPRTEDGPAARGGGGLDARSRGTLVHALLEEIDFAAPAPPSADRVIALAARQGAAPGSDEVAAVVALTGAVAGSPLCARLAGAHAVRREEPFAFALDEVSPVLNGILDVLAEEDDGTRLVVDYKTNRVADADLERLVEGDYGAQRRLYALAALQAGAPRVEVAYVFLERPAEPVTRTYGPGDAADLRAGVRDLLTGIEAGRFPVTAQPHRGLCGGCPGRGGLCGYGPALTDRDPVGAGVPAGSWSDGDPSTDAAAG